MQKQNLAQQIQVYSQKILILEGTVIELKADADKFSFKAENKNTQPEVKSTLSKSNALRRVTLEKQCDLEMLAKKKKVLVEQKQSI